MSGEFACQTCGKTFDLPAPVKERYPGWQPKECLDCKNRDSRESRDQRPSVSKSRDLTLAEVKASFHDGPQTGVFTDGSSEGNPGPGGWGAVLVVDGVVVKELYGSDPHTTNNRMELSAMIAGLEMVPPDTPTNIYTDSQLVVNILTKWAEGWKAKGWKKKSSGPIANLELVQEAYRLLKERPQINVLWIKAHIGNRWNEYADSLATAYRRETL